MAKILLSPIQHYLSAVDAAFSSANYYPPQRRPICTEEIFREGRFTSAASQGSHGPSRNR